jgi:hypothetical protein
LMCSLARSTFNFPLANGTLSDMGSDFDLYKPSVSWVRWFAKHPSRNLNQMIERTHRSSNG